MKYRTPEFRARKARALRALHALLAVAQMPAEAHHDSLLPTFFDYLYLPELDLIAVPWIGEEGDIRAKVAAAARTAFAHALMITLGKTNCRQEMAVVSVGFRKGDEISWAMRLQPWMGVTSDDLFLVPIEPEDAGRTFRLADNRLREVASDPWPSECHRDLGLKMARDILFELMERH